MKNLFTLSLILCMYQSISAQQTASYTTTTNAQISKQVDSLKEALAKDGYTLLKEAAMNMESEYEIPVIVPLTQGSMYQFVFIGDYSSRLYEVRMFDWQERQVIFRQKKWGEIDGNIISYTYVPQFSEFHMMKPVQVNKKKKKDLPGYVMLFKKTTADATGGAVAKADLP